MDFLKAEIERKKRLLEETKLMGPGNFRLCWSKTHYPQYLNLILNIEWTLACRLLQLSKFYPNISYNFADKKYFKRGDLSAKQREDYLALHAPKVEDVRKKVEEIEKAKQEGRKECKTFLFELFLRPTLNRTWE